MSRIASCLDDDSHGAKAAARGDVDQQPVKAAWLMEVEVHPRCPYALTCLGPPLAVGRRVQDGLGCVCPCNRGIPIDDRSG